MQTGRRSPTGWTAPPMWRRPPTPRAVSEPAGPGTGEPGSPFHGRKWAAPRAVLATGPLRQPGAITASSPVPDGDGPGTGGR